ncbi:hypothetical protein AEST_07610 [Alishewanella aestuarii B11]|uniref:DUF72 domain-containing protein n=1 Tax=Alishewanella aestuarii B11 TaxID=1197174 RepID=J1YET6_9ALTE|nr:DUF72 domain-containing protein [Alishewanella aestuarii]EJI86445.1 hypothetical protein AEST_07610 [Alishewanella aestuarii B11]
MLYLGCPLWANPHWRGSLYPQGTSSSDFLAHYAAVFNSVEGNTSFYADPDSATLERWAATLPADFRLQLKLPSRFSHNSATTQADDILAWLKTLRVLGDKLGMLHLQLPASTGPHALPWLEQQLITLHPHYQLCVEVRHPAFFDKAVHEIRLNRLLQQYQCERVVLDSRALFSVPARSPALLDAQQKKPRLPVHAICLSAQPVIRFIGCDDASINQHYYQPWLRKVADWLQAGKTPYCYFHTPDNHGAPALCRQFVADLQPLVPGLQHPVLALWPGEARQQLGLW